MLLQAQEFLHDKWFDDSRPIDWARCEEYRGIVALYTDLISLRLNRQGMTAGLVGQNVDVYHLNDDAKLIAFKRWKEGGAGDEVVVVMHFAEGEVSNIALAFRVRAFGNCDSTVIASSTMKCSIKGQLSMSKPKLKAPMDSHILR